MDNLSIKNLFPQSLNVELNADDYIQDGLIHCGACKQAKQTEIDNLDGTTVKVRVTCLCDKKQEQLEKKNKAFREFREALESYDNLLQSNINQNHIFSNDDGSNPAISEFVNKYISSWDEMLENNMGILFYGGVGTGKTFYADCIVNELRSRGKYATSVSISKLIDIFQNSSDTSRIMYAISMFDLIVFDDLGTERNTSYGLEKIYALIDGRYASGKPLIVTTNLDIEEMETCVEMPLKRIYDRVIEMCPLQVKIDGESKRKKISQGRKELAREMLYGKKEN